MRQRCRFRPQSYELLSPAASCADIGLGLACSPRSNMNLVARRAMACSSAVAVANDSGFS